MAYQSATGPSSSTPASRLKEAVHHRESVPKSQLIYPGQTWLHCREPHKQTKLHNCHPQAEGLRQSHVDSITVGLESMRSHELWSSISVGSPVMILTPNTHTHTPAYLNNSSCLPSTILPELCSMFAVDLCICVHQLLNKGSMTITVVTSLITGEG